MPLERVYFPKSFSTFNSLEKLQADWFIHFFLQSISHSYAIHGFYCNFQSNPSWSWTTRCPPPLFMPSGTNKFGIFPCRFWNGIKNLLISILLHKALNISLASWLVPAQHVHFFYANSHFRASQNRHVNFSTHLLYYLKKIAYYTYLYSIHTCTPSRSEGVQV